jgi:hypothetical protein
MTGQKKVAEETIALRKGKKGTFVPRRKSYGDSRSFSVNETPMLFKASMFFVETMYLTHEQRSSYITILVATWGRVMPLPDDNAFLGRLCGMTGNRFAKCVRGEIERFFEIGGGYWRPSAGHIEDPKSRRLNTSEWSALKCQILARDNHTCTYCGRTFPEVKRIECDHIIPLARGGSNDPDNLTAACSECNNAKRAKSLEEWMGEEA